jgi:acetyl-CoA carboxylase carboxyltransferase component
MTIINPRTVNLPVVSKPIATPVINSQLETATQAVVFANTAATTYRNQATAAPTAPEQKELLAKAVEADQSAETISTLMATTDHLRNELIAIAEARPTTRADWKLEHHKLRARAKRAVK